MSDQENLDTQVETPEITADQAMENTIRETYEKIQSRGEEPDEPEKLEVETDEQKAERARDEKGRFAKAEEAKNAVADAPTPTAEVEEPPAAPQVPVTAPISPELQRLGLKKEEADEIAKNPVALQAIMRRSEEMHKGLEQYREKAQFGTVMEQAITPFIGTIRALGVAPEVAINRLLSTDNILRYGTPQQKTQTFAQIAREYGIDLGQAQEFTANQPKVDPQIQTLQSELHQMRSWIEQQNQAREWQERTSLNSTIEAFSKDPANIHFEAVRNDMAGLLQAGLATDLKDAYEKAIYANPTVRAQVLAQQQKQADEARKQETIQKAQAAKTASKVNIPKKGVLPSKKPLGSMEDTIRAKAEELGLI